MIYGPLPCSSVSLWTRSDEEDNAGWLGQRPRIMDIEKKERSGFVPHILLLRRQQNRSCILLRSLTQQYESIVDRQEIWDFVLNIVEEGQNQTNLMFVTFDDLLLNATANPKITLLQENNYPDSLTAHSALSFFLWLLHSYSRRVNCEQEHCSAAGSI